MKLNLFFAVIFMSTFVVGSARAETQAEREQLCSMAAGGTRDNINTAESLAKTGGVIMPKNIKVADANVNQGLSGFRLSNGQAGTMWQQDFYYWNNNFFSRNKARYRADDPNEKPDADLPEAGMYRIDVDSPENGIICPATEVYTPHVFEVSPGDIVCVRAAHGRHYGVIQVHAKCKDGAVISWVYNPQSVPADQLNVVFAPAQAQSNDGHPTISVPAKPSGK
jgi:hypothetical protein